MAMQTTLDTFTTVKQYYNSNVKTITISTHIPALEIAIKNASKYVAALLPAGLLHK